MKFKPGYAYLLLVAVIFSSVAVNMIVNIQWRDVRIQNETLHTLIEAIGAMSATIMAVLLFQKRSEEYGGKLFLMSLGFLSMGILDGLHAVSRPGHGIVMLHGISNIIGSLWFFLIWIPGLASNRDAEWKRIAPWGVAGVSMLLGIWILTGRQTMPVMVRAGEFTSAAIAVYCLAGVLFVAAAVRLVIDYYRYETPELCLFFFIVTLLAASCFSYFLSALWNISWWSWHALRLMAYFMALGFMILDRWRAGEQLRRSEQLAEKRLAEVKTIYVTAPMGLCLVDTDLSIININDKLSEMIGMPVGKLLGKTVREIFPESADLLESRFRSVLDTGEPIEKRAYHKTLPGRPDVEYEWMVNYYPVRDENGKVFGVYVVVQDVTESRQARELQSRLSTIVESSADAIFSKTLEGTIQTWNVGAEKIFGYKAEEVIGSHYSVVGLLQPSEYANIAERIRKGEHIELYETSTVRKDGREINVSMTFSPIRDESGSVAGVSIIAHDITHQKSTENELQNLMRQNRLILESVQEGILGLNNQGNHTFINHAAAVMLGYDPNELIGKFSHATWHHTKQDGTPYPVEECRIYRTVSDGVPRRIDNEVFWRKDGTSFPVEYSTTPIYEDAAVIGTVVSFNDITERKRAEDRLKKALSELGRSNKELEQFAYIASHDLQEPLRMVSSFLKLLADKYRGRLDGKADQYIGFAVDGATRMQGLIEDLLAYSRISRGLEFSPVDVNQAFAQAVSNLSAVVRESGASVTSDGLPTVLGDATRLMQLFQNLISNALKFRQPDVPPVVRVSVRREGREWTFSVADNGIGIETDYFERIFLIFQRLHTREEYPGTGIGLTLCKKIVELHHGRIWVESVPGKGTTFLFTIPVYEGASQ